MKTGKISINFYLTKKSNECLSKFLQRLCLMATLFVCHYFTSHLVHYFYNSKTSCDRQKQIAFLKSALKSMLIKKEK